MAIYKESTGIKGDWIKASELTNGVLIKLVGEVMPSEGEYGKQNIGQCKVKGFDGVKNIRVNNTSINGLVRAFGEDSSKWLDKTLTANIEKAIVAGKRQTILYLVPEGFELAEVNGYMEILKMGELAAKQQVQGQPQADEDDIPVIEENLPF
jgi:hypothetical protein